MAGGAAAKKKVLRRFKIRGYTLKAEAVEEVLGFLGRFEDAEDEALDLLLDEIDNESRPSVLSDLSNLSFHWK